MSNIVLDTEGLSQISKLIDASSFGSDAAVDLARRAPAEDVVAVCAAAERHETSESGIPCLSAEPNIDIEDLGIEHREPLTLDQLAVVAATGDARALESLFAEIYTFVLRYCRGRLGRAETVIGSADDVAQEVCLAVVNALPSYTMKGLSFRAFVFGIAAHKVTDAFRTIGRNRAEPTAEPPDAPVLHDGPEHRVLASELAEQLDALLRNLPDHEREVLVLRVAVGLSAEETAVAVGGTPGSIRVTQHRALNRLRSLIETDTPRKGTASGGPTQIERRKWWHDGRNHGYIDAGDDGAAR